jgi:glycosyltransferase involved in cell wall biosynthesis
MREVIRSHPDASLLLVGDGTALLQLKDLSAKLELMKHVVFAGHQPFAEGIIRILGDPLLASHLGKKGREVVERQFNWDQLALTYEAALNDVLKARGPGEAKTPARQQ